MMSLCDELNKSTNTKCVSSWPDSPLVNTISVLAFVCSFFKLEFVCVCVCVCRVVTPRPQQQHGDAANDSTPLPAAPGPLPLPAETAQPQTAGRRAPAQPQACRAPPASRQHPGTNAARVHRLGAGHHSKQKHLSHNGWNKIEFLCCQVKRLYYNLF